MIPQRSRDRLRNEKCRKAMKRAIQTARQGRCLHTTPVWRNSLPTITLEGVASRQSENPDSYVNSSSSPATPPIVQQDQEDIPELSEQELIKRRDVMSMLLNGCGLADIQTKDSSPLGLLL